MKLKPKNWESFQHYKDRRPPWIKLHKSILDDRAFMRLPTASKALAPMLWLLASESQSGEFDASTDELEFRLRMPRKEIESGIKSLIENGFFVDASNVLAGRLQLAVPEKRREETEAETDAAKNASNQDLFNKFWAAYPRKVGRVAAYKAFEKTGPTEESVAQMLTAVVEQAKSPQWLKDDGQFIPHPATWLNQGRWMDEEVQQTGDWRVNTIFAGGI
jgi:hypothetical protein